MERGPIVSQYFRLRDYLNRANKLSNKATTVDLVIEHADFSIYRLFANCDGTNESHRIALAERSSLRHWERTGHTPFQELEEFCAARLNRWEEVLGTTVRSRILTTAQIEKMKNEIKQELRMLLLKKSYEP